MTPGESIIESFKNTLGHSRFSPRALSEAIGGDLHEISALLHTLNDEKDADPVPAVDLLMALNFLKEYRGEDIAALTFGLLSNHTYENRIWAALQTIDLRLPSVRSIFATLSSKITSSQLDLSRRFEVNPPPGALATARTTIDGTFCPRLSPDHNERRRVLLGLITSIPPLD